MPEEVCFEKNQCSGNANADSERLVHEWREGADSTLVGAEVQLLVRAAALARG